MHVFLKAGMGRKLRGAFDSGGTTWMAIYQEFTGACDVLPLRSTSDLLYVKYISAHALRDVT